jgi:hypothetical protein
MNFSEGQRKLFDNPNFIPTEADLRKCTTRIAQKTMQYLKKLKVPNEGIFTHPKFYKAMRVKAVPVDDGSIMQQASKTLKQNLRPVIVAGIAFYLDHEKQEAVPMSPLSASPSMSSVSPLRFRNEN